jgi:hypothetical protein
VNLPRRESEAPGFLPQWNPSLRKEGRPLEEPAGRIAKRFRAVRRPHREDLNTRPTKSNINAFEVGARHQRQAGVIVKPEKNGINEAPTRRSL